jgi:hypothetical protein
LEEPPSTIGEGPKPVLPLRVGALLTVSPSLHVQVSARADALEIRAPFGDLTIPYALITGVARDSPGQLTMNLAGATLRLDVPSLPDMVFNYLLDLLEQGGARGPVIDSAKTRHGHPR